MNKHALLFCLLTVLTVLRIDAETLTGFNSKWCFIPSPDSQHYETFVDHIQSLRPQALRYPGGTITHRWDWQSGTMTKERRGAFNNPIENLTALARRAEVDIVFVLDIVHRSLEDQIQMLKASKLPVRYIELGNEIYAGYYKKEFPSGTEYAERVNQWLPELRRHFPKAQLSVSLLGRFPQGKRLEGWNRLVTENINDIDADTYHIYVKRGVTVEQRIREYEQQLIKKSGIDIWITEYGIQNEYSLGPAEQEHYLKQLDELWRYAEDNSTIALCHILTTKDTEAKSDNFSAIHYGGDTLNAVGLYFRKEQQK